MEIHGVAAPFSLLLAQEYSIAHGLFQAHVIDHSADSKDKKPTASCVDALTSERFICQISKALTLSLNCITKYQVQSVSLTVMGSKPSSCTLSAVQKLASLPCKVILHA